MANETTITEFEVLASRFTTLNGEFEGFETKHRKSLPKYRSQYEERLKEFSEYLKQFTNLQYEITEAAVAGDLLGYRSQHIDVINIVMNKIQFLYLLPLSQELSRKYNIFNIKLAIFSILFGTFFPFVQPTVERLAIDSWNKILHKIEAKKTTKSDKSVDPNKSRRQIHISLPKGIQTKKPALPAGNDAQIKKDSASEKENKHSTP